MVNSTTSGAVTLPPNSSFEGNAHDIPAAGDNRNVTENTLSVSNVNVGYSQMYGGRTLGSGDATGNTVTLHDVEGYGWASWYHPNVYGGWSQDGKATGNTVILDNIGLSAKGWGHQRLWWF